MADDALDSLMARQTAAERLIEALALALAHAKVLPLGDTLFMMEALRQEAALIEHPDVARCMGFVMGRLQGWQTSGDALLPTIALRIEQLRQTAPDQRAALAQWQSIATPEEFADEPLDVARRALAARTPTAPPRGGLRRAGPWLGRRAGRERLGS